MKAIVKRTGKRIDISTWKGNPDAKCECDSILYYDVNGNSYNSEELKLLLDKKDISCGKPYKVKVRDTGETFDAFYTGFKWIRVNPDGSKTVYDSDQITFPFNKEQLSMQKSLVKEFRRILKAQPDSDKALNAMAEYAIEAFGYGCLQDEIYR